MTKHKIITMTKHFTETDLYFFVSILHLLRLKKKKTLRNLLGQTKPSVLGKFTGIISLQ